MAELARGEVSGSSGAFMGCAPPDRSLWHPHRLRLHLFSFFIVAFGIVSAASAMASPAIVVDAATGNVLYEQHADEPWYPASLTKLMTIYVALSAVRDHQITLDTPLVVSARAASMAPSKMGFAPGTEVTLDNALKMLIVKSANDIAVTVAEGVAGSVEAFAEDMNRSAAELGMTQSHFVNPNGLHDPEHVSSARDLAILARAIYVNFPDAAGLFGIGALRLGDEIIPTHNNMLGRYPGADGMKTGFTCSAGFNLVASAERGGHRYIAVVLGAPSIKSRLVRTAVLLDRAFAGIDHPHPMSAAIPEQATAPDMHDEVCRRRAQAIMAFDAETERLEAPLAIPTTPIFPANGFLFNAAPAPDQAPAASRIAMMPAPVFDPVAVYIGPAPGYLGPVAEARPPHSPIGTPSEPDAASAYTSEKPEGIETSDSPVKPDAAALPMKGDRAKPTASGAQKSEKAGQLAEHEPSEHDESDAAPAMKAKPTKMAADEKHSDKAAESTPHKIRKTHLAKTHAAKEKNAKTKARDKVAGKTKHVKTAKAKSTKTATKTKPTKTASKAKTKHIKTAGKPAKLAAKPKPAKAASAPD
jgi:D-alanyl-D-alanine carboxypeptidase